ncbi:hypothetical protein [Enterobacter mori]
MHWFFFLFFLILTLAVIWNEKSAFDKKQWITTGLMLVLVLLSTIVIGFFLKWLALSFLLFPVAVAKKYSIIISMSLLCVWGMKFAVALLCALFSGVMAAHKKMNYRNYEKISLMSRTVASPLFVFTKLLLSLGSVLMFSGLWLK